MPGRAACDGSTELLLGGAGARLDREAAELRAVLEHLRALEGEMRWQSPAAAAFRTRAAQLADDVSRLASRAQDAALTAAATRARVLPTSEWAC